MRTLGLAALLSVGLAANAGAISNGIWGQARPASGGCAVCHGLENVAAPPAAHPTLAIDGLPATYTPGGVYPLTILVLGPVLPWGGFNLEATGGSLRARLPLVPDGGVPEIGQKLNECQALRQAGECGPRPDGTESSCEIRIDDSCPTFGPEYPGCACPEADKGDPALCRPCEEDVLVSLQARHTDRATVPTWSLDWTAPACGFGPVMFYLAGNSANFVFTDADEADVPSLWSEPRVVAEGPCPPM